MKREYSKTYRYFWHVRRTSSEHYGRWFTFNGVKMRAYATSVMHALFRMTYARFYEYYIMTAIVPKPLFDFKPMLKSSKGYLYYTYSGYYAARRWYTAAETVAYAKVFHDFYRELMLGNPTPQSEIVSPKEFPLYLILTGRYPLHWFMLKQKKPIKTTHIKIGANGAVLRQRMADAREKLIALFQNNPSALLKRIPKKGEWNLYKLLESHRKFSSAARTMAGASNNPVWRALYERDETETQAEKTVRVSTRKTLRKRFTEREDND